MGDYGKTCLPWGHGFFFNGLTRPPGLPILLPSFSPCGIFKSSILFASLASLELVAATLYSLRIVQKVFSENIPQSPRDLLFAIAGAGIMVIPSICRPFPTANP